MMKIVFTLPFACLLLIACNQEAEKYDTIIRNGTIYDGNGAEPFKGDIGIKGDTIAFIGDLSKASAKNEIDANGNAVAPGFINMLSWANETLIEDGRSQSDIKQGVTLEVMGEGNSMGPVTDTLRKIMLSQQGDITYPITWTSLRGYLDTLVAKGISPNVAS